MTLFDVILQFWRRAILLSLLTLCLFFQVALCNQPTIVLRHWKWYRTRTFKPYSTPLWTIAFSTVTYIEFWWSVNDLQKNALKTYGTHSTVDILKTDKNLVFSFNFIFPVLIDNPNNIEINAQIRLVVSEMCLLLKSAKLMSLSTFLKWTPFKVDTLFWPRRCSL